MIGIATARPARAVASAIEQGRHILIPRFLRQHQGEKPGARGIEILTYKVTLRNEMAARTSKDPFR